MILNKLLTWTTKNPILLSLQNFFVTPILRLCPTRRYEKIHYNKNLFFKFFGIGAETLVYRHLAQQSIDLSLRYACEIVANQGYKFYSQNWKSYLLYIGLIHAYRRNYEQASIWLAEGFSIQRSRLINSVNCRSYPCEFTKWLNNNLVDMTGPTEWKAFFSDLKDNDHDYELLLIYICACLSSLQLKELVTEFFSICEFKHHSDWKKMIIVRQDEASQLRHNCELSKEEIWQGTYTDTSQKLATNVLHKTFSGRLSTASRDNPDLSALSQIEDYHHVNLDKFPAILEACHLLNRSRYHDAASVLKPTITKNFHALNSIKSRTGPQKVFLAGFGWSGSSAVHDAVRGYPHVKDMPGAGDLPALNVGADSEPMLHQGAGGLKEIIGDLQSYKQISTGVLKRFFKNYVLLMPSFSYIEYKTVHANRNIISHIGFEMYYLMICEFLYQYAEAMQNSNMASAIAAAESFPENIVNCMFSDDDTVFFNNSIFAHRARILNNVRGRSYYVVVNRNMSDQFCDQMRSNKFFNATFLEFYLVKLSRVASYKLAKLRSKNRNIEFVDIMFESWITDTSLREEISQKIFGCYDEAIESKHFRPEKSQKNVNISRLNLSSFDQKCLRFFESIGMNI